MRSAPNAIVRQTIAPSGRSVESLAVGTPAVGSPKQRATIAEWTKRIEPLVRSYSKGHAVVVDNALVRGAMTAVSWLHKTPVPEAFFTRYDEAVDWCIGQLEKSAIVVPAALRSRGTKR